MTMTYDTAECCFGETIRKAFEWWAVTEMKRSVERYKDFPKSYKNNDVNIMWLAWRAAHNYYT